MARLCRLLDHPCILAPDPHPDRLLAFAPAHTLSRLSPGVGLRLGFGRAHNLALANRASVAQPVDLAPRGCVVRGRRLVVQRIGSELQQAAALRPSRTEGAKCGATPRDYRHPRSRPPSRLSGPPLRDAGLERRDGSRGVLRADCVRNDYRRYHDPYGRRRTRPALRRAVRGIQEVRTHRPSEVRESSLPSIIRFGYELTANS